MFVCTLHTSLDIDHFEMIEARVLKLLHKKINLGGEHAHLFKLVNPVGEGWSTLIVPSLIRSVIPRSEK
jgi:hypothetical protein